MTPRPLERIIPTLHLLERAWRNHPDWRLGQVVVNASHREPFYIEDDDMMTGLRAYAFESLARFLGEHFHEDTSGLQFISAIGALLKEEGPESLHKVHDDLVALLARDEDEAALLSFVSYAGVASSSSVFGQIDDWLKALEAALSRCRGITSS